jgi:hypothetical protein
LASDAFVVILFADAIINFLLLRADTTIAQWTIYLLSFLKLGLALTIQLQHYRGIISSAMQRVAIAVVIVMGLLFYARPLLAGIQQGAGKEIPISEQTLGLLPFDPVLRWGSIVSSAVLGLIGCILTLRAGSQPEAA